MKNITKTKTQLIKEMEEMRQQLAELEAQEAERKQAEEALRESEADYRRLFKLLPVGVTILDLKGVIIYCNSAVYIKGGFPEGEFVGKHFSKIASVRIKDIPKYIRVFNSIVRGKTPEPFEAVYQHKDGTTGWTELNVDLVKVGGKQRILVIQHDITERKQAEEKQQAIIKTALDGFWACNLEGKFLEVNDSYCKITGYTREELLEMSIQDIEAIEKPEQTAQRIKKIVENGSDRFETQHKRKDGKIIDIEISVNYLNIEEGQMFVFVRDITERKQAEEALANEAIRRRILIEQSRDGIVVLDQNGNVYESNQRFAEMLGYSLEEVRQLQVWDWEFQFPPEQVLDMIQSVDETGDHFETQHRRKDGTIYDVEISTNGAVFAGEKLIFCVCRDITGRKQAEENLKKALSELEQSSARLAATNKELETFSYSVSHDLRSPLRSIDGFSQALLEDYSDKLDENGQDYLKRLRGASQKMGELIDGLLKLSRLTRSKMHEESVDLSALGEEIAARLQETQPKRRAKFIIDKGLTASGDPQLLRVLIENLLGNAWKFTGKSPHAKIEFGATRNNGKKTYFVKDNGAGFDTTYADKLFGAFQRLHDTTEFPGTGIGLATVQRIINRHGGTIQAEGAVGKGATFYFTLE